MSDEKKHTPGPWYGSDGSVAAHKDQRAICSMAESRNGDENAANRNLITAAPDLLAALVALVAHESPLMQVGAVGARWAAATAAITKARGES